MNTVNTIKHNLYTTEIKETHPLTFLVCIYIESLCLHLYPLLFRLTSTMLNHFKYADVRPNFVCITQPDGEEVPPPSFRKTNLLSPPPATWIALHTGRRFAGLNGQLLSTLLRSYFWSFFWNMALHRRQRTRNRRSSFMYM